MKRAAIGCGVFALTLGLIVETGAAQEAGKIIAPATAPAVSAAPAPELAKLWGTTSPPAAHYFADIGVGAYWMQGSNVPGALTGARGSIGMVTDRGTGFNASWQEMSRTSSWSSNRRP